MDRNRSKKSEEEDNVFDLKNGGAPVRNERLEGEKGLDRFKKDTGYDFLELVMNKQLRTKMLINGCSKKDTDEDETTLQNTFEKHQKQCWEGER